MICPAEIPPSSVVRANSGSAAVNSTSTPSKLASSRPSTSSLLVRCVNSSRISVRRSFSWATALAPSRADEKDATTNCKGASIWNRIIPNRARSPRSRTLWAPARTSQAVHIKIRRIAT